MFKAKLFNWQWLILLSFLLIIIVSLYPLSHEGDFLNFSKSYIAYQVKGDTSAQIDASFDRKGKYGSEINIGSFDAYTSFYYNYELNDDDCKISNFNFEVNYTLPQLFITHKNKDLGKSYTHYIQELYRHEEIHCAISMEAMIQIQNIARQGRSSKEQCLSSLKKINLIKSTISSIHKEFDSITSHGQFPERSTLGRSSYIIKCKIELQPIINIVD